jgi:predicted nucleic acid-binding protein
VLDEPGTKEARAFYRTATWIVSSRLLVTEASAALGRARRTGRLTKRLSTAAFAEMRELLAAVVPIELTPSLADTAATMADAHSLRAYDAVHLATYGTIDGEDSVLVANDGSLLNAARTLGYAVAVPGG